MEAIIIALVIAAIAWRAELVTKQWLALKEQELKANEPKAPPRGEPIPHFLWMNAMQHSEKWARDDALKRLYELYEELGSWDKVTTVAVPEATKVE